MCSVYNNKKGMLLSILNNIPFLITQKFTSLGFAQVGHLTNQFQLEEFAKDL